MANGSLLIGISPLSLLSPLSSLSPLSYHLPSSLSPPTPYFPQLSISPAPSHPPYPLDYKRGRLTAKLGIALLNLGLLLVPVTFPHPAQGAERIYVNFGPLEFSLSVAALEIYATEGKIEQELAAYTRYLEPEQLEQLRTALLTPVDVEPVAVAQFLYSLQGEIILERVGQLIQTKANQPGFYAIRAALIKAAAAPEGLTLLNVLREFPTYGIRINTERGFEIIEELSQLIQETGVAIALVEEQSLQESQNQIGVSFSQLPDLRQPGPVSYSKLEFTLNDSSRQRTFPVDLYLPIYPQGGLTSKFYSQLPIANSSNTSLISQGTGKLIPVIVISHGLGSERQTFAYLAAHLASYGFAVAVPEHPGSNAEQLEALQRGFASEVTPPEELIDRPLDIQFLLNELEKSFQGQLNLQQVGVLGQSFGGYTTLALIGAKINQEQLQQNCNFSNDSLNLSLLLQCLALQLPATDYNLQDERIKAAIAINPIDSTIFGQSSLSQIQVPLMIVASSNDAAAPALPEQIIPFTWLTTPNKYLVLLKKGTHFSTLAESSGSIPVPPQALGPDPTIAQEYMKALSLAFFETYIVGKSEYQVYLSAAYAQFLSQNLMPLSLVESLNKLED